jgi:hypothetical protein
VSILNENLNDHKEKTRRIRVAWYERKIRYVVPLLARTVGVPISLCRVLSVGTGGAEDIKVLANRGADSVGVDTDKENAPYWSSKEAQFVTAMGDIYRSQIGHLIAS